MMLKKVFLVIFIFIIALLAYSYYFDRYNLDIHHVDIASSKLPGNFPGLRIVQISDVHIGTLGDYELKVAKSVNSLHPDVILITGDFFQHQDLFERPRSAELQNNLKDVESFVKLLHSKMGVFVSRGNNDFSNDKEVSNLFPDAMQKIGVTLLSNSERVLRIGDARIHLLGVDYPEFHKEEVADFFIAKYSGGQCLQSNESTRNSYSHFLIRGSREAWKNYTYTGKFRQSKPDSGGLGFTFYSQFDRGLDRFFRLRRIGGDETFVLSPHGAQPPKGDIYVATKINADIWYRFKISCTTSGHRAQISARVWRDGDEEPANWQADAVDALAPFADGTVGVWSHGKGMHQFDDLVVVNALGDTLLMENFEQDQPLKDAFGWVDYNYEGEVIPWLMQFVPKNDFSILLAHTPDMIKWAAPAGVDLQLSGHTHGGQVRLPIIGAPIVRSALGRKYAAGLFHFGATTLYVNRGIGTVMLPLRVFCRPEITVFTLKSADGDN